MKILSQEEYDNILNLINDNKEMISHLDNRLEVLLDFLKIKIEYTQKEKLN